MGKLSKGFVRVATISFLNTEFGSDSAQANSNGVYDYELSAVAEQAGRWHVHPVFGVKGFGSLYGPGTYLNVAPMPTMPQMRR